MALDNKNNAKDYLPVLLAKYVSKEADVDETAIVERWIKEDSANKQYLEQLEFIAAETKKLTPDAKPDVLRAWEEFQERIKVKPNTTIRKMRWFPVAATVLFVLGIITLIKFSHHVPINSSSSVKLSAGNTSQLDTLPDGSVVELQPHAELTYNPKFSTGQRNVELKGDAFFSVAHDAAHPFQIAVNKLTVTVLGTSFKIASLRGITEVIVKTGVVQVAKEGRSMKVFPSEKLVIPAFDTVWIKQRDTLSDNLPPQKGVQKPVHKAPAMKLVNSTADDYTYHRKVMALILDDLVEEKIVPNKKSIDWAALTDSVLMVNGRIQPKTLHGKLKAKYRIAAEGGYYYGPVKISGKGYFFDNNDLKK